MDTTQICVFGVYIMIVLTSQMETHTVQSKLICVCTTTACNDTGQTTCRAFSSCYTQYLDRRDGSSPVTRGCIDDKTPLLCENRRPFVPITPWPHLVCCMEPMCNADNGIVTAPTWPKKVAPIVQTTTAQVFLLDAKSHHRNSNQPVQKLKPQADEHFEHPILIVILPIITLFLLLTLIILVVVMVRQARMRIRQRRTGGFFGANGSINGFPSGQCRGTFCTGDPYIREKFLRSVPV